MKTEIEALGFEISVDEIEGKISVKIEMNDEVIEELTLDPAEYEGSSEAEEEIKAFGDETTEGEATEGDEATETEGEEATEEEDENMMSESVKSFDEMFPSE